MKRPRDRPFLKRQSPVRLHRFLTGEDADGARLEGATRPSRS